MDPVPPAQPPSSPQGSPLFALAREIDARLRTRATTRRQNYALDALDLAECKRLELFRLLGYSSVTAYARALNGFGSSKTSDLIRIAEATERLPLIREAFLAGQLDWCAAREIVKKATPADEAEWLERARRLTVQELKASVQEKAPVYRRTLELTDEELGWVEAVADGVRQEGGPFALGKAIAEACRRMLAGEAASPGGPSHRILIHQCGECGAATRQTSEGPVPVSAAELEQVECDAEVLDLRDGPARITRTAPPKIQNYVLGRDKGRCVVPGCRNRVVQFHHEDSWRSGHHPDRCFGLCGSHHRSRHLGYLRAEGSMPEVHFYLADGTYLGRAGDEHRATDATPPVGPGSRSASDPASVSDPTSDPSGAAPAGEVAPAASAHAEAALGELPVSPPPGPLAGGPDPVDDAIKALRKLEFKAREAKAHVQRVLQLYPGRSWEAGALVATVLRGLPTPG